MKKLILILIIFFLSGCGYTPLYSSKDSNYKIIGIKSNVDNSLTNYIRNNISVFSNNNAVKKLNISFNYKEEISIILKDAKGDPAKNRLSVIIDLSIFDSGDDLIVNRKFSENFEYNIEDNKFNLKQYEKNIKLNLIEDVTQQILEFLANLK
tara:strand:+ start:66 stop:521 length:456 start_codon:yes stop_codon:yes gene_type:complete